MEQCPRVRSATLLRLGGKVVNVGKIETRVRTKSGTMPMKDPGVTLQEVKAWRAREREAGRPSSPRDFYITHGICPECRGEGVRMIGWSDPRDDRERQAAKDLEVPQLPVFDVCPHCHGTGRNPNGATQGQTENSEVL